MTAAQFETILKRLESLPANPEVLRRLDLMDGKLGAIEGAQVETNIQLVKLNGTVAQLRKEADQTAIDLTELKKQAVISAYCAEEGKEEQKEMRQRLWEFAKQILSLSIKVTEVAAVVYVVLQLIFS